MNLVASGVSRITSHPRGPSPREIRADSRRLLRGAWPQLTSKFLRCSLPPNRTTAEADDHPYRVVTAQVLGGNLVSTALTRCRLFENSPFDPADVVFSV